MKFNFIIHDFRFETSDGVMRTEKGELTNRGEFSVVMFGFT